MFWWSLSSVHHLGTLLTKVWYSEIHNVPFQIYNFIDVGQRLTTSGIFWILAFVRIIVWILCTVVRWLGLLWIDPNHHRCEKFNYNCQHMKHVTEQMKCGKELSNTTVCLDFLRRLSCVDIVCLCKTWPNKTNLIQLYKQTHLFVNMFQWCLSLQPIWSEPSASFTMSDEGAKASEVGKQHLFKWCIVVMHTRVSQKNTFFEFWFRGWTTDAN